jgi:hypothetical protein
MYDDSLATTYTPHDLFCKERGAQMLAPYRSGYLIQIEVSRLRDFENTVRQSSRVKDLVDISRVESIRFFDREDTTGAFHLDDVWMAAPRMSSGRAFLIWLMPLIGSDQSEALLKVVDRLRGDTMLPAPSMIEQLELGLSTTSLQLLRALQRLDVSDRLEAAMRTYRRHGRATATIIVPSRHALSDLVASGAVYRLEPVHPIATTSPGRGAEPERPLPEAIEAMPVVGVVDGGLTAASYRTAEAWRAPAFIDDGKADHVHGNRVASLIVQGHDWNGSLALPELYCRIGVAQAVPRRDARAFVDPESFITYLDAVMAAHPETKVWNFSLNESGACDPEQVSYLGHQISILARKHRVLPIISTGNRPGDLLQPPADCEAALTAGGRLHDSSGLPAGRCTVSLPGPGPSGMLKPEVSHFSHVRVLGGLVTAGSSFSAALTSPVAAHTIERLRDRCPDLAKALLLHSASEGRYDSALGFGSPGATMPWETPAGTVTLQWKAQLRPGAAFYWELPIPPSLISGGKLRGRGKLTAVLNPHPMVSDFAGPNYFSARVETALQIDKGPKWENLLGSIETGGLTEEQARTLDHKWSPVRHHSRRFQGKGFVGNTMRIYARCFTRDLYLYSFGSNDEVPPLEIAFVLTLQNAHGRDDLFDEVRNALGAFVEVATIDIDVQV